MTNLLHKVALGNIPNVGNKNSKNLIAYCGSAEAVFKTTKSKLLKIPGIGDKIAKAITDSNALTKAEEEIKYAEKNEIQLMFFTDTAYPDRLKHLDDSPPLLYYKGNADLNCAKILSVVGTRNITNYGKRVCQNIISEFQGTDVLIVSGLAYGVDVTAHRTALKNNLATIGVMANGMDNIYPASHKGTAAKMISGGGLLTEESFGVKAAAQKFPARNRIVAGMADATLVIESAERGGSLITANMAFNYDREVFAVPGPIDQTYSVGCNNLIKDQKAQLISSAEDIIQFMNWDLTPNRPLPIDLTQFSGEEQAIIKILENEDEVTIDDLAWKLQLTQSALASSLLNLEFENVVVSYPGKKIKLK